MHDADNVRNYVHFENDQRPICNGFERKFNNVKASVNTLKLLSIINIIFGVCSVM
ncbi:hypothetical protein Ddye_013512 [Dipteronia dyeriana]|uniref:Uncharacterized protein n=1 Tax=Dipteronia dyeriana TaxID=168575 RepID=A0AAD9X695_9ROSI|nr:hypothetical protein Ddye_013512 [Dipteronia dyeriana]